MGHLENGRGCSDTNTLAGVLVETLMRVDSRRLFVQQQLLVGLSEVKLCELLASSQ